MSERVGGIKEWATVIGLILTVVGVGVSYGTLNQKVISLEAQLQTQSNLSERLTKVETLQSTMQDTLKEIRTDVKTLVATDKR